MKRSGWGLALLVMLACGAAPAGAATTYTVSSLADQTSGGSCNGTVCTSLRAAVASVPPGSTIHLGSGIYKLGGVLKPSLSVTIVGVSPSQTTIQQLKAGDAVIEASAGDLSLSGLAITGGTKVGTNGSDHHAGGIFTAGTSLTLDHVSVTGNTATGSSAPGANGGDAVGAVQTDSASTLLTISNSSITNNTATGGTGANSVGSGNGKPGGTAYAAIADFGLAPTITNSVISRNTATGGNGGTASGNVGFTGGMSGQTDGAITIIAHPSSSTTLISGTTIANNTMIGGEAGNGAGNTARGGDGNTVYGALTGGGNTVKVVASTISGNIARPATGGTGSTNGSDGSVSGGGVGIASGGLSVINSTITGNVISGRSGEGAGIAMVGADTVLLASDTLFGNSAPTGGNLAVSGGQLQLAGTIIAGGVQTLTGGTPNGNCLLDSVTETDLGHNLESSTPSQCGLSLAKSDLLGGSPQVAALAANGGSTATMALGPLSPAIGNGGNCDDISAVGSPSLTIDERGLPRASPCDIGAFEHQPVVSQSAPAITGTPTFHGSLNCSPGTWSGDGIAFAYQWSRNGMRIGGETRSTHVVSALEFGTQLSCAVTATGTYGHASATASLTMPQNCNCTPKITKVSQSHRVWRRGTSRAHLSAAGLGPPVGTTFAFTLDRAATVTLSFARTRAGRVVRGRCVALTRANRHGRSCTMTSAAGSLGLKAHAGKNKIAFAGRLSRKKRLETRSYLLSLTAALSGGPSSRPSTLRFSIVN